MTAKKRNKNKEEVEVDVECGCPADKTRKVTDLEGEIYYVGEEEGQWKPYSNSYWITIEHSHYMSSSYVVCKEDLLPESVKALKETRKSLPVKFSGYVTKFCKGVFTIPEYTYNYITLTKITVK